MWGSLAWLKFRLIRFLSKVIAKKAYRTNCSGRTILVSIYLLQSIGTKRPTRTDIQEIDMNDVTWARAMHRFTERSRYLLPSLGVHAMQALPNELRDVAMSDQQQYSDKRCKVATAPR